MKKLLAIFLLIAAWCKAQNTITYPSTCLKVDSITNYYREDAKKLNFRFIHRSNNTYKDSIALNPTITTNFERALLAVYNATDMPASDTVVRLLNIHCTDPYMHQFLIEADSNLQWMKNLRASIIPTGYNTIDSLMSKFYLKKFSYDTYPNTWYAYLVLKSDTALNTLALERFVKTLPGVFTAAYDFRGLDGSNIEDTVNTDFHWFKYTYGWADCESGCFFHRYWQFRVHNDCSVEYGGVYGTSLTVGIKEKEIEFEGVSVYPNPASNTLNLSYEVSDPDMKISISNALGQYVYSGSLQRAIDIDFLSPGVYFLRFQKESGYKVIKIIKE